MAGTRLVIAYLRPSALEPVIEAVAKLCARDIAYAEVRGYGRQKEHLDAYREGVLGYAFLPRVRVTFAIDEGALESSIEVVSRIARTGSIGDGKIFVLAAAQAVPIGQAYAKVS